MDINNNLTNKINVIKNWRYYLFKVIDPYPGNKKFTYISYTYNALLIVIALFLLVPVLANNDDFLPKGAEIGLEVILTIDYALRWITSDFLLNKGKLSFVLYFFYFWGIIDFLGIIPLWFGLQFFAIFLIFRLLKVVRLFPKTNSSLALLNKAVFKRWRIIILIGINLIFLVFLGAAFILLFEQDINPDIETFWDAVYMVFITITTIGYGDITPVTTGGRIVVIIFSLLGIAIIALITATIVSGFSEELEEIREKINQKNKLDKNNLVKKYNILNKKDLMNLLDLYNIAYEKNVEKTELVNIYVDFLIESNNKKEKKTASIISSDEFIEIEKEEKEEKIKKPKE